MDLYKSETISSASQPETLISKKYFRKTLRLEKLFCMQAALKTNSQLKMFSFKIS